MCFPEGLENTPFHDSELISSIFCYFQGMKHYLGIMTSPPLETDNWSYSKFVTNVKKASNLKS